MRKRETQSRLEAYQNEIEVIGILERVVKLHDPARVRRAFRSGSGQELRTQRVSTADPERVLSCNARHAPIGRGPPGPSGACRPCEADRKGD